MMRNEPVRCQLFTPVTSFAIDKVDVNFYGCHLRLITREKSMPNTDADVFAVKKTVLRELTQIGSTEDRNPQVQTNQHMTMCPCTITCGVVSCLCGAPV